MALAVCGGVLFWQARRSPYVRVQQVVTALDRLAIPEAHAADAFTITPERTDVGGIDVGTSFEVKATVPVNADELHQVLKLVPEATFTVEAAGAGVFHVKPAVALQAGTVYAVSIPTKFTKSDGSVVQRDFSWAFQTKRDLRVISTIPGTRSSGVPINTGIEFKLTRDDWANATSSFSMKPSVSGRFEVHGRTLAFVPEKPLAYGTTYHIVLKKGFGVAGSDVALAADAVIDFETERAPMVDNAPWPLRLDFDEFHEEFPGKPLAFATFIYSNPKADLPVKVTGYRLTNADAKTLLRARYNLPDWEAIERSRFADYEQAHKTQVFDLTVPLQKLTDYSRYGVVLPKQDTPGVYALKLLPKDGEVSWMFLQITPTAAYVTGDKSTLLVWAVEGMTKKPLSNLPVVSEDGSARTDAQGIARIPAPAWLADTVNGVNVSPTSSLRILEIGEGAEHVFVPFRGGNIGYDYRYWSEPVDERYWSYLFIDRPLYRQDDEVSFYGFAQERAQHVGAGSVKIILQKQEYLYDVGSGEAKIYQEQTLTTDRVGNFKGKMSWRDLSIGWYRLTLLRDGKQLVTRTFEVRDYTKPTYALSLEPEHPAIVAGDTLTVRARSAFYDGTPLPNTAFAFSTYGGYGGSGSWDVMMDASGQSNTSVTTTPVTCPADLQAACSGTTDLSLNLTPKQGEEADIAANAMVRVYSSELLLDAQAHATGSQAAVFLQAYQLRLSQDDVRGPVFADRPLRGQIVARRWERVQEGTAYDFINKVSYPTYRYQEQVDAPIPFEVRTDAMGRATYPFLIDPNKNYSITVQGTDLRNRPTRAFTYTWGGFSAYDYPTDDLRLSLSNATRPDSNVAVGESVGVRVVQGERVFPVSQTPGVLFMTAQLGIRETSVLQTAEWNYVYKLEDVPNVSLQAVVFVNGVFQVLRGDLFLKQDTRRLEIEAKTDQPSYAPGSKVKVHVVVTKAGTHERAPATTVAYASIDKALEGVTWLYPESPLASLYRYVSNGILLQVQTHIPTALSQGGAEKGGGGGGDSASAMNVRKNFKDTAVMETVTTDQNGEADIEFTVPDNLTTWRTQLVAINADVWAGDAIVEARVTKPVFVDVVLPPRLLVGDKPVMKMRAYGSGLPVNQEVTYTVDAPSLGIRHESVTGTAGMSSYLTLAEWPVGHHVLTIRVTSPQGTDAIERALDVVATRMRKQEYVSVDAGPGATLPMLDRGEATLLFISKTRAALVPRFEDFAWYSARVDSEVAAVVARRTLHDTFGQTFESQDPLLSGYQDYTGGIKLLPYSSPDVEVSADVAATAPELFDASMLAGYLWSVIDQPGLTRQERIEALSGLAALYEPVLPQLQGLMNQTDLSWREQAAVARGLVAAGDLERARGILDGWLVKAETRDALTWLPVSATSSDVYEATAQAAAIAAQLAHPKAEALMAYVDRHWYQDAFPVLSRLRYLRARLALTPDMQASVSWTLDGKNEEKFDLSDSRTHSLRLTADEVRTFRVTKTLGPVTITFIRDIDGRPAARDGIQVTRGFESLRPLNALQEGDMVYVTVTSTIAEKAQDGCYTLRDHLPGGWQPSLQWSGYDWNTMDYPYETNQGEVSYVICGRGVHEIRYRARVVSRGSYKAEAPVIQHMEYPSVAGVGVDQTVIVK